MNLFFSRSAQLAIASCVFLLFFLWVAFPTGYFFLNDDFIHIPLAGSGSFFNRSFIRPVSDITLYVDHLLWQKNAAGYHVTNILLHLLSTGCLFVLASKLFRRFSPVQGFDARPWLASIMFLVNGCQTESVFWIIGRGGSLAGVLGMLSLICYLNKEKAGWWLWLSYLFFIIGIFAYEAVLALPVIVVLLDRKQLKAVMGFWVIVVLYFIYRMSSGSLFNTYEEGALRDFDVLRLLYNFNTLVARSFVPPAGSTVLLLIYILLMLVSVITMLRSKHQLLLRSLFLCVLAAVLPFVTLGADTHDSESGRFVYLSSAIACIFLVELITQLVGSKNWQMAVASLLILVHAWFFFSTANDYRVAGQVVKQSLECLRGAGGGANLENVPTQYKGALIFRSGLPEALRWYNDQPVRVNIASSKEITPSKRLSCETVSQHEGQNVSGVEWYTAFYWTDSSIVRIQP